jgi:hypothetical protein
MSYRWPGVLSGAADQDWQAKPFPQVTTAPKNQQHQGLQQNLFG